MESVSGLVIVDKPEGMTSQGVVTRVKRLFGAAKAGHTGTLDPLATGVLPVLIGRAVKASEFLLSSEKHYLATLRLGLTTDSEDVTGKILSETDDLPEAARVLAAAETFCGAGKQTPPMVSALKVGGKKLVDLARAGIEIEREPRDIFIRQLLCTPLNERDYALDVICSKGTYIRTLCADIGKTLGCGGVMATLRRAEAGGFTLADAHTLGEWEAMSPAERLSQVRPTESLFAAWEKVTLSPFFARLARNGVEIYLKKIGLTLPAGERVALYDGTGFFAVGEVRQFPEGLAVKPIRQFDLL